MSLGPEPPEPNGTGIPPEQLIIRYELNDGGAVVVCRTGGLRHPKVRGEAVPLLLVALVAAVGFLWWHERPLLVIPFLFAMLVLRSFRPGEGAAVNPPSHP